MSSTPDNAQAGSDSGNTAAPKKSPPQQPRRRWLRHVGIGGVLLVVVIAALLFWLLATVSGRNTILARIVATLPPGSLSWQRADGVISGPLTLYGVHYQHDGVDFRAQRITLVATLQPLLRKRLRLSRLNIETASLDLPKDTKPKPPPSWPDVLPKFAVPFDLGVDNMHVRGLRVSQAQAPIINFVTLDGGLDLAPGVLGLRSMQLTSDRGHGSLDGRVDVGSNYHARMLADLTAPAPSDGSTPATLHVLAGGDLDRFVSSIRGRAPDAYAVRLDLTHGRGLPQWTLATIAPRFTPALLIDPGSATSAVPLSIRLNATGTGGVARVNGRIAQAGTVVVIAPSQLAYVQGVLRAQPLLLDVLDGRVQLDGQLDLRPTSPLVDVRAQLHGLRWAASPQADTAAALQSVLADGDLKLAGTLDAWTVQGALQLVREKETAKLTLRGHGNREQLQLESLNARTPAGALDAVGLVQWSPHLVWQFDAALDRFDPGYFAPDFNGAVTGKLVTHGERTDDGALSASVKVDQLGGELRGRRLSGRVALDWQRAAAASAGSGQADIDLHVGDSHVLASGAFGRTLDLALRFAPLHLDDLLPNASGSLSGSLTLQGDPSMPAISGTLDGQRVRWAGYQAKTLHLDGRLPAHGGQGALQLDAQGLQGLAGIERVHAQINGSLDALRLDANAVGSVGTIAIAGQGQQQGNGWRGRIASLHYTPPRGVAWNLTAPANFAYASNAIKLDRACLDAVGGGALCVDADWPRSANISGRGLPLALANPWLQQTDIAPRAHGSLDLDAHFAAARNGWTGNATLKSAQGGIRLGADRQRDLLGYTNLVGQLSLDGRRVQLQLRSDLSAGGTIAAHIETGLTNSAPLSGTLALDLQDVTWLELFSVDLASPKGALTGQFVLSGTRGHPQLSGQATLRDFSAELPALGIKLTSGTVQLAAAVNGDTRITGSVQSGEGRLNIDGRLRWNDATAPLLVNLTGTNVRIANTPELMAVANPDLQLQYLDHTLRLRGKVTVTSANIDLERLDTTVSPSPDVVVLDPVEPAHGGVLAIDTDLALVLGENVALKGFGLDGKLGGELRVVQPQGREMRATGTLNVSGRYAAYGQNLGIERGRLSYFNSRIDNPSLDVLADHKFDDGVTVGVRVRGSAQAPRTDITSTPAMDSSNALAYLVLGRPLNTASGDESRQIGAAAAALSVGGNLIGQKIGARLGLDQAGVTQSRALGSAAFTVGKYLSPRLFISYGVSLVGSGEVITLKYLLKHGFDIQIESGRESRASLNWRVEK
ncbi:MAG: translocation/assembly module TamB domain-containing protein [Lysobacteraceae bacterium]